MIRLFLVLISISVIFSCSNEISLIEQGEPIPVVYALLSTSDTAHYVRLEKSFVDPTIPGDVLAQDPNNLYYDNATVTLIRNATGQEYTLTKVDGNLEGYIREEGAFAQSPNFLYKIRASEINLVQKETYRLRVDLGDGSDPITSSMTVIERSFPATPNENSNFLFPLDKQTSFTWSYGVFASIGSIELTINYQEEIDNVFTDKSFKWNIISNSDKEFVRFPGQEFYATMAANIPVIPEANRYFSGIDYKLTTGGQEIVDYLNVAQANLGITSSGEVPAYSNLSRGRGIFASRWSVEYTGLRLHPDTQFNLRTSEITSNLNFR